MSRSEELLRRACGIASWALVPLALAAPAAGQEPTPSSPVSDSTGVLGGISPGGAFLRSVLVPGWGHASIRAYTRGGLYFAVETATLYSFLLARGRLSEARERAAVREGIVRQRIADQGITDPDEVDILLGDDDGFRDISRLVASRERQQEDLVAFGIFLLFLSGADAYVSAHLADFPAPIEIVTEPVGEGRMDVGLRLRVP